jgi:zinc protease
MSRRTVLSDTMTGRPVLHQVANLILLSIFLLVFAGRSAADLNELVSETVLPNGLKVLFLENHKAPAVTFQVWYRVGSRNEEYGKTGLSHLLEHMMFKGTQKVGSGEFSRIIQENGGQHNAFTSADYTAYYQNMSADRVIVSLDLESDRMQNLMLREQDFQTERSVVMEERRLRTDDNPKSLLWEQLEAAAFHAQPYRWPVIGWMQDIARLTLDDLKHYYERFYNPANALLVIVGDFKKDEILPVVERFFGPIPKGAPPETRVHAEEPQHGERRIIVKKEAQLASVVMGYHVPNLRDLDSYALEVVAALLGSGESSRLQTSLVREQQLALGVGAHHSLLSRDPSLFSIGADALPGKDIAAVEKAIDEEMGRLQRELVGERELQKAKNQLEAGFVFRQDSLFSQAMVLARYELLTGWRDVDQYLPAIRKVTALDVQRVASRYLMPDNRTVAVLVPVPSTKVSPPRAAGSPTGEQVIR